LREPRAAMLLCRGAGFSICWARFSHISFIPVTLCVPVTLLRCRFLFNFTNDFCKGQSAKRPTTSTAAHIIINGTTPNASSMSERRVAADTCDAQTVNRQTQLHRDHESTHGDVDAFHNISASVREAPLKHLGAPALIQTRHTCITHGIYGIEAQSNVTTHVCMSHVGGIVHFI
jgi:hypothetical protein